jgi:hypothetical protein
VKIVARLDGIPNFLSITMLMVNLVGLNERASENDLSGISF